MAHKVYKMNIHKVSPIAWQSYGWVFIDGHMVITHMLSAEGYSDRQHFISDLDPDDEMITYLWDADCPMKVYNISYGWNSYRVAAPNAVLALADHFKGNHLHKWRNSYGEHCRTMLDRYVTIKERTVSVSIPALITGAQSLPYTISEMS